MHHQQSVPPLSDNILCREITTYEKITNEQTIEDDLFAKNG